MDDKIANQGAPPADEIDYFALPLDERVREDLAVMIEELNRMRAHNSCDEENAAFVPGEEASRKMDADDEGLQL